MRETKHTAILGSLSEDLQSYEASNDQVVASVSSDAVDLKRDLQNVRNLAAQLSDELAKLDIERLQGSFPISDRWARDEAKGVSVSGSLSWLSRYHIAVGADAAGMQRVSVRHCDLRDPFAAQCRSASNSTYSVATTYGLAHLVGDRYVIRFYSKRVPYGRMLEIDRPTNFPASAHVKVKLDGYDSGLDNDDLAFVPAPHY